MPWVVERTDLVAGWWRGLDAEAQEALAAALLILQERGPALGRPLVDTLTGSHLANLKELRVSAGGRRLRVLFAFDPRRVAVLLVGGDKTGQWRSWYVGDPRGRSALRGAPGRSEAEGRESMTTKPIDDLMGPVLGDPARRARVAAHKARLERQLALAEVRRARRMTQEQVAAALGKPQTSVSRLERQSDMNVSTLRGYVEAMGAELEVAAVFPDGSRVPIAAAGTVRERT